MGLSLPCAEQCEILICAERTQAILMYGRSGGEKVSADLSFQEHGKTSPKAHPIKSLPNGLIQRGTSD